MKKPRLRFCWHCGRQLWGNHHAVREYDGNEIILHKQCAGEFEKFKKEIGVDEK